MARTFDTPTAPPSGAGAGTVTHTQGALTAKRLVIGNGSGDIKVRPFWFYDVTNYGALGDGTTDDSAAFIAAIAAGQAVGGEVYCPTPSVKYRIASQLVLPNDGGTVPKQRPLHLRGDGALMNGEGGSPYGGTILDLEYVGTAKIDTRGLGLLEISGITFEDTTDGTTDFIHTTNTTLHLSETAFFGKTATTPAQDAIVMGGAVQTLDGSFAAAFQGYGTIISGNYFNRIRRWVYGKTFTNGIVITNNIGWTQSGGTAAIESDGAGDNNAGWYIAGNLIEMNNYTYAIKLTKSNKFVMIGNNFFDAGAGVSAFYRFEAAAYYNTVVMGMHDDAKTAYSEDASVAGTNNILNGHQSQTSIWAQPWMFSNATVTFANSAGSGPIYQDPSGNFWYSRLNQADGSRYYFKYNTEDVAYLQRASATDYRLNLLGSADNSIRASNQMRVYASAGQPLSLGDATNKITITSGVIATGFQITFTEMTAPSAPAANKVHLYAEDNGAGKTRLMALFPTGAAQQVAIEP